MNTNAIAPGVQKEPSKRDAPRKVVRRRASPVPCLPCDRLLPHHLGLHGGGGFGRRRVKHGLPTLDLVHLLVNLGERLECRLARDSGLRFGARRLRAKRRAAELGLGLPQALRKERVFMQLNN